MRAQLSGILADPLPWWFWAFAGAGGAWAVAEYSGAPKRKQEIATLGGLAVGALSGFILQPSGSTAGMGALPKFRPGPASWEVPPGILPATAHRQSSHAR